MSGLLKPKVPDAPRAQENNEGDAARAEELARQARTQRLRGALASGQSSGTANTAVKMLMGS